MESGAPDARSTRERSIALTTDHETAVALTRKSLEAVGFDVVAEFSPGNRIAQMTDDHVGDYTVIGVGMPEAAEHALTAADKRIGALFPCNVAVWSEPDGTEHVYYLDSLAATDDLGISKDENSWRMFTAQLHAKIGKAFERLEDNATSQTVSS